MMPKTEQINNAEKNIEGATNIYTIPPSGYNLIKNFIT